MSIESKKYYIPNIEEFHVGFEYELFFDDGNYWESRKVLGYECDPHSFENLMSIRGMRVKYLDRADIESLGFEESVIKLQSWTSKDCTGIQLWQGEVLIFSKFGMFDRELLVFKGIIKNKSELKRVLKMVGYGN